MTGGKDETKELEELTQNDAEIEKDATITGECIYCSTFRPIPYGMAMARAKFDGISEQEAADRIATDSCTCKQGLDARKRKERLESAAGYMKRVFEENESAMQMSICSIKAVDEDAIDKVSFKIGKYTYTIDKDSRNMVRVKTKFTDGTEVAF